MVVLMLAVGRTEAGSGMGPLRVLESNPRYFSEGSGRAVYLTGSHTHANLIDAGGTDPPREFDYPLYLDFLAAHHHNFIRLWTWELYKWTISSGRVRLRDPLPWLRAGPGDALDGKPKFDLRKFNPAYFSRLRARIIAARERGMYVSIMLFEGWGLQFAVPPSGATGHPFYAPNNVNGIDGDVDRDGKMLEIHTMDPHPHLAAVRAVQEAYVRKVIDTVNDLDNVLYEIANESGGYSTAWQYHMIRFIKAYERDKPQQHPVGMTFQHQGGRNADLLASEADWISPDRNAPAPYNYRTNPPPNDGTKVVLLDTDHLWGHGGTLEWVWKSFTRGHNPIFMDIAPPLSSLTPLPEQDLIRNALGHTRAYAREMPLARMVPSLDVSSTTYALVEPGSAYLIFAPGGGSFEVRLARGDYRYEWFNPYTGEVVSTGAAQGSGGPQRFTTPFFGHSVLYLAR